jgi:hypothetical protein
MSLSIPYYFIQLFLGWTLTRMQLHCVNGAIILRWWSSDFFITQVHPIIRKTYHLYIGHQTRTRAWLHSRVTILVSQILEGGWVTKGNQCLLLHPWCKGSGWKVTLSIVTTFIVWWQPWILIIILRSGDFTDSSNLSVQAVLIHTSIGLPSVTAQYAVNTNNSYESMKHHPNCTTYKEYPWHCFGELKVAVIFLGAGLQKNLLLLVWMGQSSKDFTLQEDGLAFSTIRKRESTAATTGRI